MEDNHSNANQALKNAAVFSFFLSCIKFVAFYGTGSMLVLGSFLDSVQDTFTSVLNRYVHKLSLSQADKEHPFGHGGFETIGSLIQGMLILFLGTSLFIESLRKFLHPETPPIEMTNIPYAIVIMFFSAIAGWAIQYYLGKKLQNMQQTNERSLSLFSDQTHYAADAIVNILAVFGLLFVYFFSLPKADHFFGCLGGVALILATFPIFKKCFHDIVQTEIDPMLQKDIVQRVTNHNAYIQGVHSLRSRKVGPNFFLDFHMKLPDSMSIYDAHEIGDSVLVALKKEFPFGDFLIHFDPASEKDD